MHKMASASILPSVLPFSVPKWVYNFSLSTPKENRELNETPLLSSSKISVRNGANMVSDTRENKADKRFSEKYPKTNFGYFLM